jgi:hypothetical protein
MAEEALLEKIQDLSDLELAALLCLANQEHCLIDTDPGGAVDNLVHELRLVSPSPRNDNRNCNTLLISFPYLYI